MEEQGTWASRTRKRSEAGCGRPEDGGGGAAKTVKRPLQQPAQPPIRQLLGAADVQTAHPATSSTAPAHRPLGCANAETQEHRPQRPTERSDPTQHAKGRTGDCPGPRKGTTTRRNVTRGVDPPPPWTHPPPSPSKGALHPTPCLALHPPPLLCWRIGAPVPPPLEAPCRGRHPAVRPSGYVSDKDPGTPYTPYTHETGLPVPNPLDAGPVHNPLQGAARPTIGVPLGRPFLVPRPIDYAALAPDSPHDSPRRSVSPFGPGPLVPQLQSGAAGGPDPDLILRQRSRSISATSTRASPALSPIAPRRPLSGSPGRSPVGSPSALARPSSGSALGSPSGSPRRDLSGRYPARSLYTPRRPASGSLVALHPDSPRRPPAGSLVVSSAASPTRGSPVRSPDAPPRKPASAHLLVATPDGRRRVHSAGPRRASDSPRRPPGSTDSAAPSDARATRHGPRLPESPPRPRAQSLFAAKLDSPEQLHSSGVSAVRHLLPGDSLEARPPRPQAGTGRQADPNQYLHPEIPPTGTFTQPLWQTPSTSRPLCRIGPQGSFFVDRFPATFLFLVNKRRPPTAVGYPPTAVGYFSNRRRLLFNRRRLLFKPPSVTLHPPLVSLQVLSMCVLSQ